MLVYNDVINLDVTENDVKDAIRKSLTQNFHRRDNLRNRHENVQFDCLVRGYIGEKSIRKWFEEHSLTFQESNYIDDKMGNIDIDLLYRTQTKNISLEIKTSLVPDTCPNLPENRDIEKRIKCCLNYYDIKLIRRDCEYVEDLKGDVHIQIYYSDYRNKKDNYLSNCNKISTLNQNINAIYELINGQSYIEGTFFVGWIDKETLIDQINDKTCKDCTWTFPGSKRKFWTCKIKNEAKKPETIINFIRDLA